MKKLTDAQQRVVDLMNSGWELGYSNTISVHIWLQLGGCGKGGPSQKVHAGTFQAMRSAGLIVIKENGFHTSKYKLSDAIAKTTGEQA